MEGSQRLRELRELTKLRLAKTGSGVSRAFLSFFNKHVCTLICARHCAASAVRQ